jgi:hypothetical protein
VINLTTGELLLWMVLLLRLLLEGHEFIRAITASNNNVGLWPRSNLCVLWGKVLLLLGEGHEFIRAITAPNNAGL